MSTKYESAWNISKNNEMDILTIQTVFALSVDDYVISLWWTYVGSTNLNFRILPSDSIGSFTALIPAHKGNGWLRATSRASSDSRKCL